MTPDEKNLRNALYRAGRCIVCAGPQSAGRPRCNECHMMHIAVNVYEPQLDHRTTTCAACKTPDTAKPGNLRCYNCNPPRRRS